MQLEKENKKKKVLLNNQCAKIIITNNLLLPFLHGNLNNVIFSMHFRLEHAKNKEPKQSVYHYLHAV